MNIIRIFRALWGIGNLWLRVVIGVLGGWLITMIIAALFPAALIIVPAVNLLLFIAFGVWLVFITAHPLVIAILTQFEEAQNVKTAVMMEVWFGVLLSVIPIRNDPELIPLAMVSAIGLVLGVKPDQAGWFRDKIVKPSFVAVIAFCLVIWLAGGRKKILSWVGPSPDSHATEPRMVTPPPPAIAAPAATGYPLCEGQPNEVLVPWGSKVPVDVAPNCVSTQFSFTRPFCFEASVGGPEDPFYFVFPDGTEAYCGSTGCYLGDNTKRGKFRLRGVKKQTAIVTSWRQGPGDDCRTPLM